MNSKVSEGHDNIKKNYDVHKMNEDLTNELQAKTEQNKKQQDQIETLEAAKLSVDK